MPPEALGIFGWVIQAGSLGLLIVLVYIIVRGALKVEPTWVFGWTYRALEKDRDFYRTQTFTLIETAQTAVRVAEQTNKTAGA